VLRAFATLGFPPLFIAFSFAFAFTSFGQGTLESLRVNLIALIAVFAVTSHEVHAWFGTKLVRKLNMKWRKVESIAMGTFWFVSVASRSGA